MRFPLLISALRVEYTVLLADGAYKSGSFDTAPKSQEKLRAQLMRVSTQRGREVREISTYAWTIQPGLLLMVQDILALFRRPRSH
jgi:hypothetical protein